MPIDLQQKPDLKQKLQELAIANGKTVAQLATMPDEELVMFACEVMLATLSDPQLGATALSMMTNSFTLSGKRSHLPPPAPAPVAAATVTPAGADAPMTEDRKKELMGRYYQTPAGATK